MKNLSSKFVITVGIASILFCSCTKESAVSKLNGSNFSDDTEVATNSKYEEYVDALYQAWYNYPRETDKTETSTSFSDAMKEEFKKRGVVLCDKPIFSKSLLELEDKLNYVNDKYGEEDFDTLIDSDPWIYGQDYQCFDLKILSVEKISSSPVRVLITAEYSNWVDGPYMQRTFTMVKENGRIVVDDFDNERQNIEETLSEYSRYLDGYH